MSRTLLLATACAGWLAACAPLGPLPSLSTNDVPTAFEQTAPDTAPIWPQTDWWRGFSNAELDRIIAAAQTDNLDLVAAEARVLQADARVRQAGSALLPTAGFGADAAKQTRGGSFGVSLGASYELDFWGRNRNILVAAEAARKATLSDRETVALTATTAAAGTYFQLLSVRERLAIARLNLDNALEVLMVTEARVRDGVATPLELAQQRAQIAGQQAVIPELEQLELQTRAALALLLGRPPENFDVMGQDLTNVALPIVGPGLPSELLMRRPDVVAAEAGLQTAHANVAAARAALFPSISLTGSGGLASTSLSGLVTNPIESFSFGVSLAQTIFDAGRLAAQSDEARAQEKEILAAYRRTAINAFVEVETSLGAIANLSAQQAFQTEQVLQSELAFQIAEARYREGVADYLSLLEAQRGLYGARDQLGQTKLQRLLAVIALYKALGGGWTDPAPGPIASR